ncbi:glycosyltransferase family 4 protein [Gordonia alkanivorans]|uniref:glycosyltransferase family 4 protein n=1 Tax=Gordonia alkanivorans TaxID=84096 RepID=UPI002448E728|nr:glycosyltransferase family 4 protein [Gordonia alkanivorans]MDH3011671.1 glycosyltransferase family 4 protein [Gordonia alkanivorans]
MIRVLAVSPSKDAMGAEQSLLNIAPLLATAEVDVTLAAPSGGTFEKRWRGLGLAFRALEIPERRGLRSPDGRRMRGPVELISLVWRTVRSISRLMRVVRETRAQVIHSNLLMTHLDCAVTGRLTRTGTVLELHEIVAPGIGRWALGFAVRLSDSTIAISGASRDQVPSWVRDKVIVIPQCVDVGRFETAAPRGEWRARLADSPECPIVAAVGRVDPEKGLHVLVDAVARVRENGVPAQLAVVGSPGVDDGGYLTELVRVGTRLLGDALRIVPHVDDVAGVLGAVDVLACPSFEEPFGMILLEAQVCQVPVVACRSGGPGEFIVDEETGLLVEPGDADGLARAVQRLLGDAGLRARIAEAGAERVRDEFVAPVRAARVASHYHRLAAV